VIPAVFKNGIYVFSKLARVR